MDIGWSRAALRLGRAGCAGHLPAHCPAVRPHAALPFGCAAAAEVCHAQRLRASPRPERGLKEDTACPLQPRRRAACGAAAGAAAIAPCAHIIRGALRAARVLPAAQLQWRSHARAEAGELSGSGRRGGSDRGSGVGSGVGSGNDGGSSLGSGGGAEISGGRVGGRGTGRRRGGRGSGGRLGNRSGGGRGSASGGGHGHRGGGHGSDGGPVGGGGGGLVRGGGSAGGVLHPAQVTALVRQSATMRALMGVVSEHGA
eukprot:364050-Chlamydomonas_euryale.AAC.27